MSPSDPLEQPTDLADLPAAERLTPGEPDKSLDAREHSQAGPLPAKKSRLEPPADSSLSQAALTPSPQRLSKATPSPQTQFYPTPISLSRKVDEGPIDSVEFHLGDGDSPTQRILRVLEGVPSVRQVTHSQSLQFLDESNSSIGNEDENKKKRRFYDPDGPAGENDGYSEAFIIGSGTAQQPFSILREEQKQLHIIAKHPGDIALLPDSWAGHFKGFPIPHGLFYKKVRKESRWPRIYERTAGQDFHGSKMLLDIVKVQSRVRDIRNEYLEERADETKDHIARREDARVFRAKYVKALKYTLGRAIKWAWKDGNLDRFDLPPTIAVFEVTDLMSQADVHENIEDEMEQRADQWRAHLEPFQIPRQDREPEEAPGREMDIAKLRTPKAPVLYGFAIMEHNLLVLHLDASRDDALPVYELCLNMETDNQRQWYALVIMVIICYARDRLMALTRELSMDAARQEDSSDPDA